MTLGNMCLMIVTVIVIITGALMALLVGLVLPREFLDEYHMEGIDYHHDQRALDITQEDRKEPNYYIKERNDRRNYTGLSGFSWLVSVNLPRYDDDKDLLWFACTGVVVLSNDKVLVGDACFRKPFNVPKEYIRYHGRVRCKSAYFSEEGEPYEIKEIHSSAGFKEPYGSFFLLILKKPITDNVLQLPSDGVKWTTAIEVGWGGNKIAHADVLKYERFHHEKWSVHNDDPKLCGDCGNAPSQDEACYLKAKLQMDDHVSRVNGRPLVTEDPGNPTLLGMQMDYQSADDSTIFIDMRFDKFRNWVENTSVNREVFPTGEPSSIGPSFIYRKIDSYTFCLEKERDEYLAQYFLEQKQSLDSEGSTRSNDGNQTHEIEKRKSSNEPNLRAKKSSHNLDRNLQKFGAIRTAELADTERQKLTTKSSTATIVSVDKGLTSVSHTFYPSSSIPIVTSDGSTILRSGVSTESIIDTIQTGVEGFSKFPSTSEAFLGVLRIVNEKTETAGKGSLSVDEVAIDAIYATGTQVYEQSISFETITSIGGAELITEAGSETEKLDVDKLFPTESGVDEIITTVVTSEETDTENILQTITESIIIATMSSVAHGPTDVSGRFNFPPSNLNISSSGSVFTDEATTATTSNDTMKTKKSHPIEFTPRISVISSEKTTLGGEFDSVDSLNETKNTGESDSTSEIIRETTYTMTFIDEELTATSESISRRPSESTEVTGTSSKATVESIGIDMMPTRESVYSSVYTSVTPVISSQRMKFGSDDRTTALKIIESGHSERKEDTTISPIISSRGTEFTESSTKTYITNAMPSEEMKEIEITGKFNSPESTTMLQTSIKIIETNGDDRILNEDMSTRTTPSVLFDKSESQFTSSTLLPPSNVTESITEATTVASVDTEDYIDIKVSNISQHTTPKTPNEKTKVVVEVTKEFNRYDVASKKFLKSVRRTKFNTELGFVDDDVNMKIESTSNMYIPESADTLETSSETIELNGDNGIPTRDITIRTKFSAEYETIKKSKSYKSSNKTLCTEYEAHISSGDDTEGTIRATEKTNEGTFKTSDTISTTSFTSNYRSALINDDTVDAGIKSTRAISTVEMGINDKYDSGILLENEAGITTSKPYVNMEINSFETHVETDIHHGLETVYNDDFNTESRAAPSTDLEIGTLSSYTASRNESKSISHDVVTDTDSNLFEVNRSSEFDGSIESSVFAAETSDEKTRSMRTIGIEIHSDIKHRPDTEFSDASRNSSGSNSSKIMIGENPGVIKEVVSSTVTDMGGDIVLRTDNSTVDDARDKEMKV